MFKLILKYVKLIYIIYLYAIMGGIEVSFQEKILEIVEIISEKSELKEQILENTKILLNDYEKNKDEEDAKESYWDYIVTYCLAAYDEIDWDGLTFNDFGEDDYLKAPVAIFDWKAYAEDYIGGLETLIESQKLDISLKDIEYDDDKDDVETLSCRVNNKLKPLGYILTNIDVGSDEYNMFILKEEDFNTIKNIIEEDEILSEVIKLVVFEEE